MLRLQELVRYLPFGSINVSFIGSELLQTKDRLQVKFETSSKLLENPSHMETLVLRNLACSWKQLSILTQHFNMSDSHYPTVRDKNDVYNELQSVVSFGTQGLKLLGW